MQSRRHFLGLFAGFAATRCAVAPGSTRPDLSTPRRLTVTLAISGMT